MKWPRDYVILVIALGLYILFIVSSQTQRPNTKTQQEKNLAQSIRDDQAYARGKEFGATKRKEYADYMQTEAIKKGILSTYRAVGPNSATFRIHADIDRSEVYQIANDPSFRSNLLRMGFKKLIIYNFISEWSFDLE